MIMHTESRPRPPVMRSPMEVGLIALYSAIAVALLGSIGASVLLGQDPALVASLNTVALAQAGL
jgi:hypothetical protein